jgi:hypothetical protein
MTPVIPLMRRQAIEKPTRRWSRTERSVLNRLILPLLAPGSLLLTPDFCLLTPDPVPSSL